MPLSPTALVLSRCVGACTQQQPPPLSSPASLPLLNSASCNFLSPHSCRCFLLLTHITPSRPKVYRGGGGRCSCHIREQASRRARHSFKNCRRVRAHKLFFPLPPPPSSSSPPPRRDDVSFLPAAPHGTPDNGDVWMDVSPSSSSSSSPGSRGIYQRVGGGRGGREASVSPSQRTRSSGETS